MANIYGGVGPGFQSPPQTLLSWERPTNVPELGLAERIKHLMRDGAKEALLNLGEDLARRTIADIPIGDPRLDPNPEYALRDHVHVRQYANFVSVTVEGEYVIKQHEALSFKHPRGGFPKFLERNAVLMAVELEGHIAGVLRRKFAAGNRPRTVTTSIGAGRPNS